jgi:hypothetical protein
VAGPIVRAVLSRLAGFRYDGSAEARDRLVEALPLVAFSPRDEDKRHLCRRSGDWLVGDVDPPNWELITPGGVVLAFGPGVRWQTGSADRSSATADASKGSTVPRNRQGKRTAPSVNEPAKSSTPVRFP